MAALCATPFVSDPQMLAGKQGRRVTALLEKPSQCLPRSHGFRGASSPYKAAIDDDVFVVDEASLVPDQVDRRVGNAVGYAGAGDGLKSCGCALLFPTMFFSLREVVPASHASRRFMVDGGASKSD